MIRTQPSMVLIKEEEEEIYREEDLWLAESMEGEEDIKDIKQVATKGERNQDGRVFLLLLFGRGGGQPDQHAAHRINHCDTLSGHVLRGARRVPKRTRRHVPICCAGQCVLRPNQHWCMLLKRCSKVRTGYIVGKVGVICHFFLKKNYACVAKCDLHVKKTMFKAGAWKYLINCRYHDFHK